MLFRKLLPVRASVNEAEPAATLVGLMVSSVGTGFGVTILKASAELVIPPPFVVHGVPENGGFSTTTEAAPAMLSSELGTLTVICVEDATGVIGVSKTWEGSGGAGAGGTVGRGGGCQQTMAPEVVPLLTRKSDPARVNGMLPAAGGTVGGITAALFGLMDWSNGVGFGVTVGVMRKFKGLERPLLPAPEKGLCVWIKAFPAFVSS